MDFRKQGNGEREMKQEEGEMKAIVFGVNALMRYFEKNKDELLVLRDSQGNWLCNITSSDGLKNALSKPHILASLYDGIYVY